MKQEKELVCLFTLYGSEYCERFLKKPKLGCKKDFQRLLKASENDSKFFSWFDELLSKGVFKYGGIIQIGNFGKKVKGYYVDPKNIIERIRINPYYDSAYLFFEKRSIIGVSK